MACGVPARTASACCRNVAWDIVLCCTLQLAVSHVAGVWTAAALSLPATCLVMGATAHRSNGWLGAASSRPVHRGCPEAAGTVVGGTKPWKHYFAGSLVAESPGGCAPGWPANLWLLASKKHAHAIANAPPGTYQAGAMPSALSASPCISQAGCGVSLQTPTRTVSAALLSVLWGMQLAAAPLSPLKCWYRPDNPHPQHCPQPLLCVHVKCVGRRRSKFAIALKVACMGDVSKQYCQHLLYTKCCGQMKGYSMS